MVRWIDDETALPSTRDALPEGSEAPGLLAAGGRLSVARLDEAYRHGIFPWYGPGQPVLWWAPDPRMVLPVAAFKVSRSLRKTIRRFAVTPGCEVRVDSAFERVMRACAETPRQGQSGSWIVPTMVRAYCAWHRAGAVHSVETWIDGELAGGLYCVSLGGMVFGESMFAHRTDASKIALAALVCLCREHGVPLIDCQQNTRHLASLGAHEVSREAFEAAVRKGLAAEGVTDWTYHPRLWAHLDEGAGAPREARP